MKATNGTAANHEILIAVSGKVDSLAVALDERLTHAISTIGEHIISAARCSLQWRVGRQRPPCARRKRSCPTKTMTC